MPPVVVSTSPGPYATGMSGQRKIDRCQNGVLWAMFTYAGATDPAAASCRLKYSLDSGDTWSATDQTVPNGSGLGSVNYYTNPSMFIDLDDFMHILFNSHPARMG